MAESTEDANVLDQIENYLETGAEKSGPNFGDVPIGWTSTHVVWLSCSILVFGLIIFSIMAYLLIKKHEPMAVLRICALPLIIVSSIFLVIIGYTAEQIAPVLGLLGSIAGYLLGAASK